MAKEKSIKVNFLLNSILQVFSVLFPLLSFRYVSEIIMPVGTGKVAMASSVVAYFTMFAMLGIPTYGIRACAKIKDDRDRLSKCVQEIVIMNLITAVIVYIVFILALFLIPIMKSEMLLYMVTSVNILLNVIGVNWLYSALEEYKYITIRSIIFKILAFVAMLLLVKNKNDYVMYAAITTLANAGSNILNCINLRKHINIHLYRNYHFSSHLKPILSFFAMSVSLSIYSNLDTVMLGVLRNEQEVGYYNAAIKIKTCLLMVITALGTVLLPRMSYYYEKKKMNEFKILEKKAVNVTMILSLPLACFFILFAPEAIYVVAGNQYNAAIIPMQIIMVTVLITGITNNFGNQILIPSNREKGVVVATLIGASIDLLFNIILIPEYGAAGAATASVLAVFGVLISEYIMVKNIVNDILHWKNFLKILFAVFCTILLLLIPKELLYFNKFWNLVIAFAVGSIVYFIILLITKEEISKEIFDGLQKRIKRGFRNSK